LKEGAIVSGRVLGRRDRIWCMIRGCAAVPIDDEVGVPRR
jgi:hypothetical protein